MIPNEQIEALRGKQFYKFTGPPENWLTAIKFKTWGINENSLGMWQKIQVGDIFLMHSTGDSEYKQVARSRIIGIGIIGPGFKQKTEYLWPDEFREGRNKYPLMVPFAEIYLFSALDIDTWNESSVESTVRSINILLNEARPLPQRFPVRGSIARVDTDAALSILQQGVPENLIEGSVDDISLRTTHTPLQRIRSSRQGLRFTPTLKYLQPKKMAEFEKKISTFERNNESLERALKSHQDVIDRAIAVLEKEYDILGNLHVDLAAENEREILLFEAKSIPEKYFRAQARRGFGQLYQYEYFDIKEHQLKNDTKKPIKKILLIPHDPGDSDYVEFLKWGNVETVVPTASRLITL
jgi:hypothetical protein